MTTVTHVKRCQKDQGQCGRCGRRLPRGSAYIHWSFRYSGTRKRCMDPKCYPKPSELTSNEFMSQLYNIQEQLETVSDPVDVEGLISDIRDLGSEQSDKQQNMPESLQYGDTGQLLEDRSTACDEWADELEAVEMPVTEVDGDEEFSPSEALEQYLEEVRGCEYSGE